MEIIEFLERTEHKNIKSYIGVKIKKKLLECEQMLNKRKQMLKHILESENIRSNEELVLLVKEKLNEQLKKRLDWVNTKTMERVQAEEELLKLKNQQRELENCEAWRILQSKQWLLDSKKGQLYQIEDKKLRAEREKQIDQMWHEVISRFTNERECQEIYKNQLIKVIERTNQLKNREIHHNNKTQMELEGQQAKRDFQEDDQKALDMEEKLRKDEKRREFYNKMRQNRILKSQIFSNCERKSAEAELLLKEAHLQNELEDRKIFSELEESKRQKTYNKTWQKYYLENCFQNKQRKVKEDNEFERMYLNTGSVLQQSPKIPYGKNSR